MLVGAAPVMLLTAAAVKLSSNGPVLFRQTRMGEGERPFTILKFRTMRWEGANAGPSVTKHGDSRLTRIGAILRKTKLDELPQLINVLRGDMSLVGPRPKVPQHQTHRLNVKPGITGAASLAFRNEEQLLQHLPEHDLENYQISVLMPLKRQLDEQYARTATLSSDIALMIRTAVRRNTKSEVEIVSRMQSSLLSLNAALTDNASPVPVEAEVYETAA